MTELRKMDMPSVMSYERTITKICARIAILSSGGRPGKWHRVILVIYHYYYLDFDNSSGHGRGAKLQLDRKTPHKCNGSLGAVTVVNELPMTEREKRIEQYG